MCFIFHNKCFIILQDDFTDCMLDYSVFILLSSNMFLSCRLLHAILSRTDFIILSTKVSQDLILIWWMSRAMDKKRYFWSIIRMIYIPFYALARALTHIRVCNWQGNLYYHLRNVTSTVGIFPSRFFIIRFYNTFINIFLYFHKLKHVYSFF